MVRFAASPHQESWGRYQNDCTLANMARIRYAERDAWDALRSTTADTLRESGTEAVDKFAAMMEKYKHIFKGKDPELYAAALNMLNEAQGGSEQAES